MNGIPPLASSADIFSGLSISGSLFKNSSSSSSYSLDTISQFLRSSQADFSFDMNMANISPLLSSVSLSKDVADEISQYLRERSGDDAFKSPPLLSSHTNYSDFSMLKSAMIDKGQLDSIPMPAIQSPTSEQISPPTTPTNFIAPPVSDIIGTSTTAKENKDNKQKGAITVDGLTQTIKRRLSLDENKSGVKKKRQEKNREAAQLFRQRQKAKVHELEHKMETLLAIHNEYRMSIDALFAENKMLREQLVYWKNVVASGILITRMPTFTPAEAAITEAQTRQAVAEECKKVAENISVPPPPLPPPSVST